MPRARSLPSKRAAHHPRSPRPREHRSRQIALIFSIAIAVNYPWELAQSPLYVGMESFGAALPHCFVASVGDGFLVLLIFVAGWLVLRDGNWFARPRMRGYLLMLAVGLVIGVSVEWAGVHIARRWLYTERMPRLPGLDVGALPIAQMLLLPPLIFCIVRRLVDEAGPRRDRDQSPAK